MFVDEPQADSFLIVIHFNSHMHNFIQFDTDPRRSVLLQQHWEYFLWEKKGFPAKCMKTPYLRQANKRPLFLKDNYSMSATLQRGLNVLRCF